jgi:hypothetical protein
MKASEIKQEHLLNAIFRGVVQLLPSEVKALAQAELDRRKVDAPVIATKICLTCKKDCINRRNDSTRMFCDGLLYERKVEAPVVKWWKHTARHEVFAKTVNDLFVEHSKHDATGSVIFPHLWTEITEAEYLAATAKPPLMVDCPPVVDEVKPAAKCDCVTGTSLKSCSAASRNWICTRPNGHSGDHVACGTDEHNMFSWPQETTKPAAPVVEPWVKQPSYACEKTYNEASVWLAVEQLQRRLEAVEKAGRG